MDIVPAGQFDVTHWLLAVAALLHTAATVFVKRDVVDGTSEIGQFVLKTILAYGMWTGGLAD